MTVHDGRAVRYTVRIAFVPGQGTHSRRVVTSLGPHKASVLAADALTRESPSSVLFRIEIVATESTFEADASDLVDRFGNAEAQSGDPG